MEPWRSGLAPRTHQVFRRRQLLAIAHRGASGHAPENTFAAFRKAIAMGAGFIETDLQLSRDARLVAIHDATVNRTTNGQGAVHDLTLAELRRLDAGSWFGSEFAGERIPTIEEILEFAKKHDVVFYLELKPSGSWGGEHALISALRESGEIARTVVISFDPAILANVRKIEPTVMTGLLFEGQISDPLAKAIEIGARQLAVRGSLVTPRLLKEARQRDLQVVCWTVNHPAHMRLLVEAVLVGITSGYFEPVTLRVWSEIGREGSMLLLPFTPSSPGALVGLLFLVGTPL